MSTGQDSPDSSYRMFDYRKQIEIVLAFAKLHPYLNDANYIMCGSLQNSIHYSRNVKDDFYKRVGLAHR